MITLICFVLAVLASPFKSKSRLEAENAVLRHQLIVLRRKVRGRAQLTNNDHWFLVQMYRWFSLGRCSGLHDPGSRPDLWQRRHAPIARHGHPGQAYRTSLALAERLCRTADRIDPARVLGPRHCPGRGSFAPNSEILRRLLQQRQNASVFAQGRAGFSLGSVNRCDQFTRHPGRTSPPLRPRLSFRYTQAISGGATVLAHPTRFERVTYA